MEQLPTPHVLQPHSVRPGREASRRERVHSLQVRSLDPDASLKQNQRPSQRVGEARAMVPVQGGGCKRIWYEGLVRFQQGVYHEPW